jgi:hypothetical protein
MFGQMRGSKICFNVILCFGKSKTSQLREGLSSGSIRSSSFLHSPHLTAPKANINPPCRYPYVCIINPITGSSVISVLTSAMYEDLSPLVKDKISEKCLSPLSFSLMTSPQLTSPLQCKTFCHPIPLPVWLKKRETARFHSKPTAEELK